MARHASTLTSARTGRSTAITATSAPTSPRHPSTWPCAARQTVSNVPQIQFNDDDVWHDFAPDRVALKAGPWFPFLQLEVSAAIRLSDHSVHRPRAVKSAGKIHQAPAAAASAAAAAAADGAGAASDEHDESVPPPQQKARHEEGSSK